MLGSIGAFGSFIVLDAYAAARAFGLPPTGFRASRPLFAVATWDRDWPMASASFGLSTAISSMGIGQVSVDLMETPA